MLCECRIKEIDIIIMIEKCTYIRRKNILNYLNSRMKQGVMFLNIVTLRRVSKINFSLSSVKLFVKLEFEVNFTAFV